MSNTKFTSGMQSIETDYGKVYFKPVMIDIDGTNLEEGTALYDEDGVLIDEVLGLEINEELLDKNNIPEIYTKADYDMQLARIHSIFIEEC